MGFDCIRSHRFYRIRRKLPPFEADHLGNRRGHFGGQANDFAHEERPCAGVRVKRGRRFDLGVSGPGIRGLYRLCPCRHFKNWCDPATNGRLLNKLETSGPHSKLYAVVAIAFNK